MDVRPFDFTDISFFNALYSACVIFFRKFWKETFGHGSGSCGSKYYNNVLVLSECSFSDRERTELPYVALLKQDKKHDPRRLVSNSRGGGSDLGEDRENLVLDNLTSHTSRHRKHWVTAAEEISSLLKKFNKPVIDDEPARNGTREFDGPEDDAFPHDHILQFIMYGPTI